MRHSARITAVVLSAVLAASVTPVAADVAAAAAPEPSTPSSIDLGDDMISAPATKLTASAARAKANGVLAAGATQYIDISVVSVSGAGGADPTVVPTNDPSGVAAATAFVQQLDAYWDRESNGAVDIALGRLEFRSITSACNTTAVFRASAAVAFSGDYYTAGGDHLTWPTNRHLLALPTQDCALGLGTVGGGGGIMVSGAGIDNDIGVPVALHEFGHNLGLAHANGAMCATESHDASDANFGTPDDPNYCFADEYADFLDIMGFSVEKSRPHLSSPQKDAMGWITGQQTVSSTTTTTILPFGGAAGTRTLKVLDPHGEAYYVEYRTPDAADGFSLEFTAATQCPTEGFYNSYQRCWGTTSSAGGVRVVRGIDDDGGAPGTSVLAIGPINGESANPQRRDTHLDAGESFSNYDGDFTITVNSVNTTAGASVTVAFGVTGTTTALNLSAATAVYNGAAVRATGTVTPAAPGTIEIFDGTTLVRSGTLSGGTVAIELPNTLTAGTHSLTAKFVPSSSSFGGSSSSAQTVTATVPATVTLTAVANTGSPGIRVSAIVTLADGTAPSGSVQFVEGGGSYGSASVSGGVASLNIPTIAAGNHSITAHYKPTKANYLEGSTIAGFGVAQFVEQQGPEPVVKTTTKVTAKFVAIKTKLAKKSVLNVTVSGSGPTGTITVLSKGKKIASFALKAAAKGKAKITLPKFKKVGTYKITVKYSGSGLFAASTSKALNLKIIK